ncbi:hypothetical protein ACFOZ5_14385 [Marinobacter lacisalsi]|uniref:Uncharacterized protein n=1 Tax=Marinobacter lacisalsi TaxID=475979 RepID=A0ABV8QKW1_9GAMM
MSADILRHLPELRADSEIRILTGMTGFNMYMQAEGRDPEELIKPKLIANSHWDHLPENGANSLKQPQNRQSVRKVLTLPIASEDNVTSLLNTKLMGGRNYPVLTAVLGAGVGLVSGGASLLFSAGSTALSVAKKSQKVLARAGDELWKVEEIGKVKDGASFKVVHVSSYFLVDPYRKPGTRHSWLIHEERKDLTL